MKTTMTVPPWRCDQNIAAYDGVEDLAEYPGEDAIRAYRRERLRAARPGALFVRRRVHAGTPLDVLDLGSGSGGFLFALDDAAMLGQGLGVEVSKSRHAFARKWKEDEGRLRVTPQCADLRDFTARREAFDLCSIIDHTFAYLYPVAPDLPERVLDMAHRALRANGRLLLDLTVYAALRKRVGPSGVMFERVACERSNTFSEAHYQTRFLTEWNVVETQSRYRARSGGQDKIKCEYSRMYTLDDLDALLRAHGFVPDVWFEDFEEKPFAPDASENLVILATKHA